jgi:hypothetical protein
MIETPTRGRHRVARRLTPGQGVLLALGVSVVLFWGPLALGLWLWSR